MTIAFDIREATEADRAAIQDLNTRAFGRADEASIIGALEAEGAVYFQGVAHQDGHVIGHVLFYRLGVRGKLGVIGLGPMCVDPWVQKEGVGKALAKWGLDRCREAKVPIVFVVGHPEYYPTLGFSQDAAKDFACKFSGSPALMAQRLRYGPPMSGDLLFPQAFGI